jgi:5-methylcytosine-specific restriction endonuclease McrA
MVAAVVLPPAGAGKPRLCERCRQRKPRDQFGPPHRKRDTVDSRCLDCRAEIGRPGRSRGRPAHNRFDGPCPRCGSPVERDSAGKRRCGACRNAGNALLNAERTSEQRRAERQRAAERKGKRYTPGVKPWEAPKPGFTLPSDFAESRWRALERRNAIEAWRSWVARAPAWWLAARAEYQRQLACDRWRDHYRRNADEQRLRQRLYKNANPSVAARSGDKRWCRIGATADGSVSRASLERLLRQRGHCPYCGGPIGPSSSAIDHMQPVAKGGSHILANILVVCRPCNARKAARTWRQWLTMLAEPYRSTCARLYRARTGEG